MTPEVQLNTSIAQSEDDSQTLPIDMNRLLLSEQNTTLSIDEAQMNNRINAIKKTQVFSKEAKKNTQIVSKTPRYFLRKEN